MQLPLGSLQDRGATNLYYYIILEKPVKPVFWCASRHVNNLKNYFDMLPNKRAAFFIQLILVNGGQNQRFLTFGTDNY
jgi:hypothetical protein